MVGRTRVLCDQPNNARVHAHSTQILEVYTHAHVRPHIACVRAERTFATHPLLKEENLQFI